MTQSRATSCIIAAAEAFRGDGAIVCSPMGTVPRLGALLAKATFEPDLLISDGAAEILRDVVPLGRRRPPSARAGCRSVTSSRSSTLGPVMS